MSQRLPNYLRTYRKHHTLSQRDVAHLVGKSSKAVVSRHERRERVPKLKTALAYEAALQVPTSELFAGTYEKVEEEVADRAVELSEDLVSRDEDVPHLDRKLDALQELARPKMTPAGVIVPATS